MTKTVNFSEQQLAEITARYERRLAAITKEAEDIRAVLTRLKGEERSSSFSTGERGVRRGRIQWEKFILDKLQDKNELLFKYEMRDLAFEDDRIGDRSAIQVDRALSAALYKLKDRIQSYNVPGKKGYAYGLPEWFEKDGSVKEEFADKEWD
ncbi:hypothetical protein [Bernardetia sp.]|uniref:hypothetical protein n=1 Tax=Bernardetia sp. TaxID=1937974 RepID=UPI0025B827E5|nr:hypothetical protein [Bernardetia sp.]